MLIIRDKNQHEKFACDRELLKEGFREEESYLTGFGDSE